MQLVIFTADVTCVMILYPVTLTVIIINNIIINS